MEPVKLSVMPQGVEHFYECDVARVPGECETIRDAARR